MREVRNPKSIRPMNLYLRQMAHPSTASLFDVDCVYRNYAKDFWLMFEWKNLMEDDSGPDTLEMLYEMDDALCKVNHSYAGLFLVKLGFNIADWPLDDDRMIQIQHIYGGVVEGHKVYPTGAKSALQYILDYGKLL